MKLFFAVILILCAQSVWAQSPTRITFDTDEVGELPSGWVSRDKKNMTKVYSVEAEGGEKFLRAGARNQSVQISYALKWNIKYYPIFRWRWRALMFPTGSNEQIKSGGDSVLGLYVVYTGMPFVTATKYVWSDTLPTDLVFDSPYSSGTKIIVLRSGRARAGEWVGEERNLLSDYEQSFGKAEKQVVARAIAILTDSDNTSSLAVGDYADISITR